MPRPLTPPEMFFLGQTAWDATCHVTFGRHSSHSQSDRKYSNE